MLSCVPLHTYNHLHTVPHLHSHSCASGAYTHTRTRARTHTHTHTSTRQTMGTSIPNGKLLRLMRVGRVLRLFSSLKGYRHTCIHWYINVHTHTFIHDSLVNTDIHMYLCMHVSRHTCKPAEDIYMHDGYLWRYIHAWWIFMYIHMYACMSPCRRYYSR